MIERIDAHHHLWRYRIADYGWIDESMDVLRRDHLPADLKPELERAGINGAIAVQARQTLEETDWLLSTANEYQFIKGVVGWAPIASNDFPEQLNRLRSNPRLKGLRHVIQDEPDPDFMHRPDFNRGISDLAGTGLVYDLLVLETQLPAAIEFVDRHPKQIIVLDHIGKPRIKDVVLDPWRRHLAELAKRQNVYCKISGMVTEAKWHTWTLDELQPYFDLALKVFGVNRLMAGSDWPVCLLSSSYVHWFETLNELTAAFSEAEKEMIFGGVAADVYRLPH